MSSSDNETTLMDPPNEIQGNAGPEIISSSVDTEITLPNLPEDVWCKVFTYLELVDRKCIRLTCRRFYEVSNSRRIQQKEKFSFSRKTDFNSARVQSLLYTGRKTWNINLNGVDVAGDVFTKYFENRGANIYSLILNECKLAPGMLKSIIEHCQNLNEIALKFDFNVDNNQWCENMFNDMKALQNARIFRQNVTDFSLKLPRRPRCCLTNCKFLRFFTIFPNITNLEIWVEIDDRFNQFSTISSAIESDTEFSFSCLYDQLFKMRSQLVKLKVHFKFEFDESYLSVQTLKKLTHIEMVNLKELSLNWIDLWDNSLRNPFSVFDFKYLSEFSCEIGPKLRRRASTFIRVLLLTAKGLRSLIIGGYSFIIDNSCFEALVKSQLTTLKICFKVRLSTSSWSLNENYLRPNHVLKYLDIPGNIFESDLLEFIKFFRCLDHIEVQDMNDAIDMGIIKSLFMYQTRLSSLTLYNCTEFPNMDCNSKETYELLTWLQRDSYLLSRPKLEHLTNLNMVEDNFTFTSFILDNFQFPKLKVLDIYMLNSCDSTLTTFLQTVEKVSTQLEYLIIEMKSKTSFLQWSGLLQKMTKLRILSIKDTSELFKDSEYNQLYKIRPTLQKIYHNNWIILP